jgi:hypothetical protein
MASKERGEENTSSSRTKETKPHDKPPLSAKPAVDDPQTTALLSPTEKGLEQLAGPLSQFQVSTRLATIPVVAMSSGAAIDPLLAAQEMLQRVAIQTVGLQTRLHLEVESARLSKIGLDLHLEQGRLHASFTVADQAGMEVLKSAATELEQALQSKGVAVASMAFALETVAPDGRDRKRGHPAAEEISREEQQKIGESDRKAPGGPVRVKGPGTDYVA